MDLSRELEQFKQLSDKTRGWHRRFRSDQHIKLVQTAICRDLLFVILAGMQDDPRYNDRAVQMTANRYLDTCNKHREKSLLLELDCVQPGLIARYLDWRRNRIAAAVDRKVTDFQVENAAALAAA